MVLWRFPCPTVGVFWNRNGFPWQYHRYFLCTSTNQCQLLPCEVSKHLSARLALWWFVSFLFLKVGGGEDIFATIRWSQKLLYHNGQFSVEVPFRFPPFVNPLPKVFMKREKIQLTVNTGMTKEVILQGTSHPLKVIKYLLLLVVLLGKLLQHIITTRPRIAISGKSSARWQIIFLAWSCCGELVN